MGGGRGDCQREMIIPTSVLARLFFPLELVCDSWRNRFRSNSNCSLHFWFCSRRCWFCSSSCGGNQSIPGGTPTRGKGERGKENCLKWRGNGRKEKKCENKFFFPEEQRLIAKTDLLAAAGSNKLAVVATMHDVTRLRCDAGACPTVSARNKVRKATAVQTKLRIALMQVREQSV